MKNLRALSQQQQNESQVNLNVSEEVKFLVDFWVDERISQMLNTRCKTLESREE